MRSLYINYQSLFLYSLACLSLLTTSCLPEDEDLQLGPKAEAAFTITEISTDEMRNTYRLESTTENAFVYQWNPGEGGAPFVGNKVDTIKIENKGEYTITLTTLSEGGHSTTSQKVIVDEDAVTGTSAVVGGDMMDEGAWDFTSTGSSETVHTFTDGALTFTNDNPAQSNVVMWQALELKGGRSYDFSADVKGSGMSNSWLEIFLMDEAPEEGVDPSGSVFIGLNTWTGCGVDPFDGSLNSISCLGDGRVNIAEDGTYYLIIKVGSWDGFLGTEGLTLDNVQFIANPRLEEGANILTGSNMDEPGLWTITNMGLTLTSVEFTGGVMKFTNGSGSVQTNVGVWQTANVEAGQIYKLKATVNDSGSTGSWTEFYLSRTAPVDGVDYNTGRVYPGDTKSFDDDGTVYILIKAGSWDGNLGAAGVTVDDVELVEMN